MKRIFLFFSALMFAFTLNAQHVAPLGISLTSFNLDSMRASYQGTAYMLELQRLDKLMKDDTKLLKDAQNQLKGEKNFHKQMNGYVDKMEASIKNMQALSQKEMDEMTKLRDNIDKQLQAINSNNELTPEARAKAVGQLKDQHRAIEAMIKAISGKMSQLANYPAEIQQMRTDLLMYSSELTNKEADIKQMENTLNARRDVIKNEMKNVKSQK